MGRRRLSVGTAVYVWTVLAGGSLSASLLLASTDWSAWRWTPIVIFGLLSIVATALSITYQGFMPARTVHQIGTSFAYALFLLVDPSAVCLVLCAMTGADWIFNRRKPLPAFFNMAQLSVSLGAAVMVRRWIDPRFMDLGAFGSRTMLAASASLLMFFVTNHLLTHGIVSFSSRRSFFRLDSGMREGALNEVLCIASGIGMAVFWSVKPWLVLLGVIPIWIVIAVFILLSIKEQELENRQAELKSLQGLGLEIGAELDVDRLRLAVVRIATEALHVSGALLAILDGSRERILFVASHDLDTGAPESAPLDAETRAVFEKGSIQTVQDFRTLKDRYPSLSFLKASGALFAPLQILGRREGLLVLFHGDSRRPFNDDDVRRVETLVRFVDVALSNAQLVADLKQMQEQLVQTEKMSALGMLVSGVAHEINNPLTSVVGYTQLVLGEESDPRKRRMLTRVFSEAERAGKIVQNLLTFSRKHKVEKKRTDINQVLEQVLELRAYDLRVNNVEIDPRFSSSLPKVLVDPHQFQQIFLNLITNAEHAIRETGRAGIIRIETVVVDDTVRVIFADNGPGIRPDNLRKVFLPFFTTKEVGRGTGLGLSICYGIVQEHGGRIEVTSKLGEGATFIVEIPTSPDAVDAEEEVAPVDAAVVASIIGRLLVVDDEEAIASLVRDTLEPEGWQVATARDGAEALERLNGEEFDVLLVDMRMPGMDGRTFFERLRIVKPEMARRVVFATGDAASDSTARFLDDTGSPVLDKPYNLKALIDAVSKVAGEVHQEA